MFRLTIILILLFSVAYSSFGQNFLKGSIKDKTNRQLMPFVSIAVKDQAKGTVSDEKGNFIIKGLKNNDTLAFHYVGYEVLYLAVDSYKDSTVYLIPTSINLNEVEIISKNKTKIAKREKIGNTGKTVFHLGGCNQYVMWLPNKEKKAGFFESITIDTAPRAKQSGRFDVLVRLKIYAQENGVPTNEITSVIVDKRIKPSTSIFTFELKQYIIPFIEKGCFIGIEVIGKYDKNNKFIAISQTNSTYINVEVARDDDEIYTTYFKNFGKKWHTVEKFPTLGGEGISVGAKFTAKIAYYE